MKTTEYISARQGFLTPRRYAVQHFGVMRQILLLFIMSLLCEAMTLHAGTPVVSNVRVVQRVGTGMVDVYFDVSNTSVANISMVISTNSGVVFNTPAVTVSGDVGSKIATGIGMHVVWNAGADLPALYFPNMEVRISASNVSTIHEL